ncbi:OprD family outer membrane porin [Motiliproteus sp.]|uniref:OprD family outer membrane porin n=1 Tax=Motiliproteus sp. TaxID=1898955 RepID=UPI003BAAA6B9
MNFKRSALYGVMLTAISAQAMAQDSTGSFINDSKVDAKFRTFYFNRDFEGRNDAIAAAQALRLDYQSGYASDLIGFDASLFTVGKLSGDTGEGGTGVLQTNSDGSQSGYTKIGQAYLKLKLGQEAELKAGRMVIDTPLFNDSDSRITPSSTQVVMLDGSFHGADLYGIWSDKASAKTEDGFHDYVDNQGNDYEVIVLGGGYTFDNKVSVHAAHGQADNVLRQTYFNVSYPMALSQDMTLLLDAHHYIGEADGDGALDSVGSDYDSDLTNLAAQLRYQQMKFTLSYQAVNGDEYEESWDGFTHDDNGLVTWNSVQRLDFDRADERSWQARLDYKFKSVPGLSVMTRYTRGDNIDTGSGPDGKEWERNVELRYNFPYVEGLSLRWRNSTVRSTETSNTDENRLILNYNIALL